MISPFCERTVDPVTGFSYGLSSCGYDVRVDEGHRDLIYGTMTMHRMRLLPGDHRDMVEVAKDLGGRAETLFMRVAPGRLVLMSTVEHFALPLDLAMNVKDKSSWVRRGLTVQNTKAEPGWRGHLTLEVVNHSGEALYVPVGSPIAQVEFIVIDDKVESPYRGKYQDQQRGPQISRRET